MYLKRFLLSAIAVASTAICMNAGTGNHEMLSKYTMSGDINYHKVGKHSQIMLTDAKATPPRENEEKVSVSVSSAHNPDSLMVYSLAAYNESTYQPFFSIPASGTIELTPGTYDFCMRYSNLTWDRYFYVIREKVEVKEGTTLSFDPVEATNVISFTPVDQNGNVLQVTELQYVMDNDGNWIVETVKEGNCAGLGFQSSLLVEGRGYITGSVFSASGGSYVSFEKSTNININNISDRYTVVYNFLVTGNNDEIYYMNGKLAGCDGNINLRNDAAKFSSTAQEFDLYVPEGLNPNYASLSDDYTFLNGIFDNGWTGGGVQMNGPSKRTLTYNQAAPVIIGNSDFDYQLLFSPGLAYLHVLGEDNYTRTCGISAAPTTFKDGKLQMYFTGNGVYAPCMATAVSANGLKNLPGLPGLVPFSFTQEDACLLPGASTPALCFMVRNSNSGEDFPYFSWDLEYRGILGEIRNCDLDILKPVVKYGGVVQDVTEYDQFYSYPSKLFTSQDREKKKLEVELSVQSKNGTGQTISNNAKIMMDLTNDDFVPPTLRMLQLRDNAGKITNVFEQNTEINFTAIAGDFNFDIMKATILSETINAEFYYAPAGTDQWEKLNMEVDNEYSSANFGYFYKGVATNLPVGIYDLKISLKDQADNYQEQVMTNVFTVKEVSGVKSIGEETIADNVIYDLFGNRVDSPQSGTIYICNGQKIVWK